MRLSEHGSGCWHGAYRIDKLEFMSLHTGTAYAKIGDYILGVVFHPKPSSVSDVAGIQSVHASLN